tara:strand:- start:916 stop:1215 length:300 start_codon:yes stop_codon:yes gene_type:complete
MSESPFSFLISSIANINMHTEILEMCDWDEERLERFLDFMFDELGNLNQLSIDSIRDICYKQNFTNDESKPRLFDIINKIVSSELNAIVEEQKNEGYEN